jgi:hypothetical protein
MLITYHCRFTVLLYLQRNVRPAGSEFPLPFSLFLLVTTPVGLTPNPERCGPMIASTTKREQPCTGNEHQLLTG